MGRGGLQRRGRDDRDWREAGADGSDTSAARDRYCGNDCCRTVVCSDHDVVVCRRSQMSEEEFTGHRVRHRRTDDVTVHLGRYDDMADIDLVDKQGGVDKAFDAVQHKGNDLYHGLELVGTIAGLHDGFASIKVQQQIDTLPGTHGELVDQFNPALYGTGRIERDLVVGLGGQDNRIGEGWTATVRNQHQAQLGVMACFERRLAKAFERAIGLRRIVEIEQIDFTRWV